MTDRRRMPCRRKTGASVADAMTVADAVDDEVRRAVCGMLVLRRNWRPCRYSRRPPSERRNASLGLAIRRATALSRRASHPTKAAG